MPSPLVTLDRVDVRLWGRAILRQVSLAVRRGEGWAVVGGNGSGKSTLLRLLRGDEQPTPATRGRRRYHLGRSSSESPIGARPRIALVSPEQQDAYLRRDWDVPAEAAVRSGFTGEVWPDGLRSPAEEVRIREAMARLGVDRLRGRSVLTLSAGELRRVLLARALVARPRLLLLDEPCDGLDAAARRDFLSALARLARRGPTLVMATHRIEEIVPGIARVAVMEGGRIVDEGPRAAVLARWMGGKAAAGKPARPPGRAPRGRSSPPRDPPRTRGRPLLRIEDADVRVDGRPVLHGVGFEVRRGEHWAVTGPNGAGKSTLLRLAVGDAQAMPGGRVSRLGLGPRASVWEVKARVGLVTPELQARFRADIHAEELVLSGFTSSVGIDFRPTPRQRRAAASAMRRAGAARLAGRRIHSISYGELRRLLLARALVREPRLLVLDEPMNGLDRSARAGLLAALDRLARQGVTLILATHHRAELPAAMTHELEIQGGRVAYRGPRR